jgi:hypothetical protein
MFESAMKASGDLYSWSIGRETAIDSRIDVKEIMALIRYAAENGIDTPGPDPEKPKETTVTLLNDALNQYKILTSQSPSGDKQQQQAIADVTSTILYHYTKLTQSTKVNGHQVNGRTLIDTQNSSRAMFWLFFTTITLAALAVFNEILVSWSADKIFHPATSEGAPSLTYFLKEHIFHELTPFIWGALGGCIYLSMRLYDIALNRAFDRSRFHGWVLRVLLASIIGAVTFYIISPEKLTDGGVPIATKTLAFLAGLGVKVVYGAFEKLIDTMVEKFNLDSLRRAPSDKAKVREYFALQLSDPKIANDPQKRDAIVNLMKELGVEA